jgi:DNA-binding NtrC family response regulator
MAEEHRRVVAATQDHARALADNLRNQGFEVSAVEPARWHLRKQRRRGDVLVTIDVTTPPRPANWAPPTGPPAS